MQYILVILFYFVKIKKFFLNLSQSIIIIFLMYKYLFLLRPIQRRNSNKWGWGIK